MFFCLNKKIICLIGVHKWVFLPVFIVGLKILLHILITSVYISIFILKAHYSLIYIWLPYYEPMSR